MDLDTFGPFCIECSQMRPQVWRQLLKLFHGNIFQDGTWDYAVAVWRPYVSYLYQENGMLVAYVRTLFTVCF